MAAGYPADKPAVDARIGSLIISLRDQLEDITRVKAWFDRQPDADLIAQGWSTDDVATMKSAFTDLDKLAKIANGQATQATQNDFFFWADKLTGLN
jgi:hypothetical protein